MLDYSTSHAPAMLNAPAHFCLAPRSELLIAFVSLMSLCREGLFLTGRL